MLALGGPNVEIIASNHQRLKVKAGSETSVMFKILNKNVINWPEDSKIENDCEDIAQSDK